MVLICLFSLLDLCSRFCVPSQFDIPSSALVLDALREGQLAIPPGSSPPIVGRPIPHLGGRREGVLLKSPQVCFAHCLVKCMLPGFWTRPLLSSAMTGAAEVVTATQIMPLHGAPDKQSLTQIFKTCS